MLLCDLGILEAGVDLRCRQIKGASENMLAIANGGLIGVSQKWGELYHGQPS